MSSAPLVASNAGPTVISVTSEPPSITVTASASPSPAVSAAADPSSQVNPGASPASASIVNVFTTIAPSSSPGASASNQVPQTVVLTSTQAPDTSRPTASSTSPAPTSSSQTGSAALATSGASASSGGGISAGGKIAVAVVVPVVAVALLVAFGLLFWRRRKQRKSAEDLRRKEVEEYGYNPNHDPHLPAVAGATMPGPEMIQTDGDTGYRGWGATSSTVRKPSTTLSSSHRGAIGVARSTSGSENGRYTNNTGSPTQATNKSIADQSDDPLLMGGTGGTTPADHSRPLSGASETIGALGTGPLSNNHSGVNRGPSNASSAYSGAHRSDLSANGGSSPPGGGYFHSNENMYFDEGAGQQGPYGDGSYGGAQPVIRDVPARRNTRIESPSVLPPQGSAGIAQNF